MLKAVLFHYSLSLSNRVIPAARGSSFSSHAYFMVMTVFIHKFSFFFCTSDYVNHV